MSDLGYSNRTQSKINNSLNDLAGYIDGLIEAIRSPEPAYQEIGIDPQDEADEGDYRQLSVNRLQIENEYYSAIRPKRVAYSGERPTEALRRGGVEYVEIRSLDLNVFDPVGINQNAMRFVEAFLIYCLLTDSPPLDETGLEEAANNQSLVARRGRDPGLELTRDGSAVSLPEWGSQIKDGVLAVAELLDRGTDGDEYSTAVDAQAELLAHPEATPSGRLLQELQDSGSGFFAFAMEAARGHKEYFSSLVSPDPEHLVHLEQEASDSHRRQKEIEDSDTLSFEEYLTNYFAVT